MRPSLHAAKVLRGLRDLRLLSRPLMWLIPLTPFTLGYLMAHHQPGPHPGFDCQVAATCSSATFTLLTGLLTWGPLICLAVLAINDVYDVPSDTLNPRRSDGPVAAGRVSVRAAFIIAHVAAGAALVVALAVAPLFALTTSVFLTLGWLYSVPPVRFKTRPGFDVLINAVGDGGLSLLGGWAVIRPIDEFPWAVFMLACMAAAALYLPTTVADRDSDLAAGYTTIAVRLGARVTYRIGLSLWILTGAMSLLLAAKRIFFPPASAWILLGCSPALISLYHWAFARERDQASLLRRMGVVGLAGFVPLVGVLALYLRTST